jgi:hypothetical protein
MDQLMEHQVMMPLLEEKQSGIIFSVSLDQSMECQVMMPLLEDKQYLGREDLSCPHFVVERTSMVCQ